MQNPNEITKRLKWVQLYEKFQSAGLVCLRCGISRPTLRKWLKRYKEQGEEVLKEHSRRPLSSPSRKIDETLEEKILSLREQRKLGARRIQNELIRLHSTKLSLATVHKILQRAYAQASL